MNYKLSDNLNHLMQWKEISQKELASMIGVSAPAVSSWQRGIREIPSSRIDAVCAALGCRRSELLEGHFPPTGKAAPLIIEITGRDYSGSPFILPGDRINLRRLDFYDLSRGLLCGYSIKGNRPRIAYLYETGGGILISPINRPAFLEKVVPFEDIEIIGIVKKISRTVNQDV